MSSPSQAAQQMKNQARQAFRKNWCVQRIAAYVLLPDEGFLALRPSTFAHSCRRVLWIEDFFLDPLLV